jgi:hypothetical protein
LHGNAEERTRNDLGRAADGEPDFRCPAAGKVDSDVCGGIASPDDEDTLAGERLRISIARGVHQFDLGVLGPGPRREAG